MGEPAAGFRKGTFAQSQEEWKNGSQGGKSSNLTRSSDSGKRPGLCGGRGSKEPFGILRPGGHRYREKANRSHQRFVTTPSLLCADTEEAQEVRGGRMRGLGRAPVLRRLARVRLGAKGARLLGERRSPW